MNTPCRPGSAHEAQLQSMVGMVMNDPRMSVTVKAVVEALWQEVQARKMWLVAYEGSKLGHADR